MSVLSSLRRHFAQGTLAEAIGIRLGRKQMDQVRWYGADTPEQGATALVNRGRNLLQQAAPDAWLLSLGDGREFHRLLNEKLNELGIAHRVHPIEQVLNWQSHDVESLAGVLCGYVDARRLTQSARALAIHPVIAGVPFEYVAGLDHEKGVFGRLDEYRETFFVSPLLLDEPSPYAIYEESLKYFEQKCGLRDFLDLYQLIKSVVVNRVPGDIAEFGSYRGHSGWLIARSLEALGSNKRLYMFDTFEAFPTETSGVDRFWSQTHQVDYEDVRSKLSGFGNVTLVKGDFTQTLAGSGLGQLALAYIDCDSYRATRFLFDALLPQKLSQGGVLVCEDYGHPALLGNRAAVHESLTNVSNVFQYFSQFSGLYWLIKN